MKLGLGLGIGFTTSVGSAVSPGAALLASAQYRWVADDLTGPSPSTWVDQIAGQSATIAGGATKYDSGASYTDAGATSRTAVRDVLYLDGTTGRVDLNITPALGVADEFTIAFVGRYWVRENLARIVGGKDGGGAASPGADLRFNSASNAVESLLGDGTNQARTDGDPVTFSTGAVGMIAQSVGANLAVWSNEETDGSTVSRGAVGDATAVNSLTIGSVAYSVAALPEIEVAEIIVWDSVLSFADLGDVWAEIG